MRHYLRCAGIALVTLSTCVGQASAADSLGSVRSAVRTEVPDPPQEAPAPEPKPKKESTFQWNDPQCDEDDDKDDGYDLGVVLAGGAILVSAPYWGPQSLIEDDELGPLYFAPAPYDASPGSMVYGEYPDECPAAGYKWATRTRIEYLDDFDSLTGYRGHLLTEHHDRLGFDGELNYWQESLAAGGTDELWTGDANVVLRFAQNERIQMRSGIGVAWLHDNIGTDLGFNFTYGGDLYPIRPLVISADLDAGWIGHAWMLHLRSTVGLQWKQVEVFSGYDYLEIGDAQLDGFIAGARFLF